MAPPFKLGAQDGVIRFPKALVRNKRRVILRRPMERHDGGP